jgi:Tfp pilus assembly protein PilE
MNDQAFMSANCGRRLPLQRQHGGMLLGVIIAVMIIAVLMIGLIRSNIEKANERAGAAQGQTLLDINKALGKYITESNNTLALQTSGIISGVANTLSPTLTELQALGYLSANFSSTPANGGSYVTQIVLLPAGCVATACNIATRLWLTKPVLDGFTLKPDIKRIGALLGVVGGNAGFSDPQTPSVIRGAGWTLANPLGSIAGSILVINGFGSTVDSNYVRMRDSRDPNLQGNLTVAGNVTSSGYLGLGGTATFGGACSSSGLLGKTSNGVLMICQGGSWQNVSGIDQVVAAGAACVAGQVGRDSQGVLMSCQGGVFKNAAGLSSTSVTPGGSCSQSGLLGLDAVGVSYLCRGGYWISQSMLSPFAVEMARYIVSDGSITITKPACSSGGTSTYDMTPMSISMDLTSAPPYSAVKYLGTDYGWAWVPSITLVAPNGATQSGNNLSISALFKVYCTYPA